MPSESLLLLVAYSVIGLVGGFFYLYGCYLSFSISRALAVPIYRSRALWTGLVGLLLLISSPVSLIGVVIAVSASPGGPFAVLEFLVILPVLFVVGFVWIDRTISVLIRLDHLRRDIVGWKGKRLRLSYWVVLAVQLIFYYWFSFGATFSTPVLVLEYLWFAFFAIQLAYSSLAIAIGSARTADATFRSHVKWLSYFLAAGLIGSMLSFVVSLLTGGLIQPFLGATLGAYFFYRMAKSLAPLNRL